MNREALRRFKRLKDIQVSPALMRDAVDVFSQRRKRGEDADLASVIAEQLAASPLAANEDMLLAAQTRILALARLVQDRALDEWVIYGHPNGAVLFQDCLFLAAATEPLLFLVNDEIGFDPKGLRERAAQLTKGAALPTRLDGAALH